MIVGPGLAPLRTVNPSEVAAALADSLSGGQPIATLPADPMERARAIAMFQPDQPVVETDAAVVVATSGSTGAPKGVVLSRAAIRASAEATHSRLGGAGDWALALPTHYVAGLMVLARACLGGTHAVPVRSDLRNLQEAADLLSERRYISLVPAQLDRALHHGEVIAALTSFSAVLVGGGLFALGMPNPVLWGLLAGALRFIPYVGAMLGAVLPTLIAFAVTPGWMQPFLVLGWIVSCDLIIGQIVEPLLFGESTGVTPLALIMSAIFWGTLWGPIGLLLSTPLTICLLVLGTHVPHFGFLQILLGAAPALAPYQQIYHRLIRKAVADASTVALAEIEEKGREKGLYDSMGRMVILAEADRARDRLSATQIEAIVEGTDEVLAFIADADADLPAPIGVAEAPREISARFHCVGGRGQIDDAAAAIVAFALRRAGLEASTSRHSDKLSNGSREGSIPICLICYASHPSEAIRRYTLRKVTADGGGAGRARHVIIDYDVAPAPAPLIAGAAGPRDCFVGDLAALCRLAAQHALAVVPPAIAQAVTEPRTTSQ